MSLRVKHGDALSKTSKDHRNAVCIAWGETQFDLAARSKSYEPKKFARQHEATRGE